MKLYHPLAAAFAALLPLGLQAAWVCEPLEKLSQKVNYCDENSAYVNPAKACLKTYKDLVDAENAKIQKALNQDVKGASGTQQSVDFQTTQKVLKDADVTLTNLLNQGQEVLDEFEDYTDDFVLPVYEAYPEDYELDPDSDDAQKIFREKECYGEPMEDFDGMKAEIRKILGDLEKTKAKAAALHGLSGHKENNLGSIDPQGASKTVGDGGPAGKAPPAVKGESKNGSSTITGVEEDKKKSQKPSE